MTPPDDTADTRIDRAFAARDFAGVVDAVEALPAAARSGAIRSRHGAALMELGRPAEARDVFAALAAANPEDARAANNLGAALHALQAHDAAADAFARAAALRPDLPDAQNNHAAALVSAGRLDEARTAYDRAVALQPDHAVAHRNLSTLKRYGEVDAQLVQVLTLLTDRALADDDRCHLCFAAGKAFDDLGDTSRAFRFWAEGNALRRAALPYDARSEHWAIAQAQGWAPPQVARPPLPVTPIFVVGMPRSGTSLVEQILASHPAVHGLGERNEIARAAHPILRRQADGDATPPTPEEVRATRAAYGAMLARLVPPGATHATDKMPLNFRWLGLIAAALPEARLVWTRRDARAVGFSIFRHYFSADGNRYAYDMADIARLHRLHDACATFWGARLEVRRQGYEALTEDQETETRALLRHCGLDFDAACLDFAGTRRRVATASAAQVRRGLYTGSSEAWRRYEAHLGPMLEILDRA
ncbi:MAG: sulfotransferase [Shimia sp.]